MGQLLEHKGYLGSVRFDPRDMTLRGRGVNIEDIVTFQGKTPDEVVEEFRNSIEDYLTQCEELGEPPDKPFSGRLTLRMSPRTHQIFSTYAQANGKSLNGQVSKVLDRYAIQLEKRLNRVSVSVPVTTAKADTDTLSSKTRSGKGGRP